jgi:hypothetical protein
MAIVLILAVIAFATVLSIIEIPKMRKEKLNKELWTYSILLGIGVVLAIMKILNVKIPNPSDLMAWVYSPVKGIMQSLTK